MKRIPVSQSVCNAFELTFSVLLCSVYLCKRIPLCHNPYRCSWPSYIVSKGTAHLVGSYRRWGDQVRLKRVYLLFRYNCSKMRNLKQRPEKFKILFFRLFLLLIQKIHLNKYMVTVFLYDVKMIKELCHVQVIKQLCVRNKPLNFII